MLYNKDDNLTKGTTVETTNFHPGELIHMDLAFYVVTPINGFTSIPTFLYENTRILRVFPNAPKRDTVRNICFTLTIFKSKQHPYKCVIVDDDGALENSADTANPLVYDFIISMKTTGDDASWINGNNERHNISLQNMGISGLFDSNQHEKMVMYSRNTIRSLYIQTP